jgi:hypothetical protein
MMKSMLTDAPMIIYYLPCTENYIDVPLLLKYMYTRSL